MTREDLTNYIAFWKKALGLNSWTIVEVIEQSGDPLDGALMSVHRHHQYEDAVLHVHPWCVGDGPPPLDCLEESLASDYFFEYKVVHELLHMVMRDLRFVPDLDGYLHRDVINMVENVQKQMEERTVDNLAKSLVEQFGIGPVKKKRK